MIRLFFWHMVASTFFVGGLLLCGLVVFVCSIPSSLNTTTVRTDAVVVLTGGARRVELGYQRLHENRADRLFISGVYNDTTRDQIFATLAGFDKKTYRKLAPKIDLGYNARDTLGNAVEVAHWVVMARKMNVHSIRVVTASYHMPRSMWELKRALPGIKLIADPAFPPPFHTHQWWRNPAALQLVGSEYLKTIYCMFRPLLPSPRSY